MCDTCLRMLRGLRKSLKKLSDGRGPRIASDVQCNSVVLGSVYGGHAVCPDDLDQDSVVYSFGIGEDASFDEAVIKRFGADVHAFDPTPRSLDWLRQQDMPAQFHVNGQALGVKDGTARFFKPKNANNISHSMSSHDQVTGDSFEVPVRTLRTLMAERSHGHIDVLKMDIEGSEYEVLDQLVEQGIQCNQLLVEFHHQLQSIPYARTRDMIERLALHGYGVFYVSDTGREVSIIRHGSLARATD